MSTQELRNFVNGDYAESRATERIDLVDPATEEVYGTLARLDRSRRR